MNDPFALIAIIISALILPACAVLLLVIIRRVAKDHRMQVQERRRQWHRISNGSELSDESESGHVMEELLTSGKSQASLLTRSRSHIATQPRKEPSHLPQVFDKVFDEHQQTLAQPAVILAMRRSLLQEVDLGFQAAEARMLL